MISVYTVVDGRLERGGIEALSSAAVWIDLLEPTPEEERAVERMLALEVPTREEMQEIEASSRLYRESGAIFVTAPVVTNADSQDPRSTAVTFIAQASRTVTVRYGNPQSFVTFAARAMRQRGVAASGGAVLLGLLETIVDRLADVLERIGGDLDGVSRQIFRTGGQEAPDLQEVLRTIGRHGDLTSRVRDSLLGIARVAVFVAHERDVLTGADARQRLDTLSSDIRSLNEHAGFLSSKINFLLDATLGMMTIQQNNTIKIFSVMAVIFLPPTLIATIYGMNFARMPELAWQWGYPLALVLMVVSAILPYLYFKRRGWL